MKDNDDNNNNNEDKFKWIDTNEKVVAQTWAMDER